MRNEALLKKITGELHRPLWSGTGNLAEAQEYRHVANLGVSTKHHVKGAREVQELLKSTTLRLLVWMDG